MKIVQFGGKLRLKNNEKPSSFQKEDGVFL